MCVCVYVCVCVTGNRIEEIEQRTFEGLGRLRVLDLDRNHIYFIDARAFAAVPELRSLRLASNSIRVIYEDMFLSLPNLRVNYAHIDIGEPAPRTGDPRLSRGRDPVRWGSLSI